MCHYVGFILKKALRTKESRENRNLSAHTIDTVYLICSYQNKPIDVIILLPYLLIGRRVYKYSGRRPGLISKQKKGVTYPGILRSCAALPW